jgi:hypothetical protein
MKILAIMLFAVSTLLFLSCGQRGESSAYGALNPTKAVVSIGGTKGLTFTATGSGEGWNTGYGDKDWHYFAPEESDKLVECVAEIRDALRKHLEDNGALVHGTGEDKHAFISYTLHYKISGRRGTVEVLAARVREGSAVDVRINETP